VMRSNLFARPPWQLAQSTDFRRKSPIESLALSHIHMLLELGLSWAAKRGLRAARPHATRSTPEATQAAPKGPCDEPRRSQAVEVIPAHASAVCGFELAALLAHGASRATAVHDLVVAWFGLRCGAAVPEGEGQSTRMYCRAGMADNVRAHTLKCRAPSG
jgi:hypothetical protein